MNNTPDIAFYNSFPSSHPSGESSNCSTRRNQIFSILTKVNSICKALSIDFLQIYPAYVLSLVSLLIYYLFIIFEMHLRSSCFALCVYLYTHPTMIILFFLANSLINLTQCSIDSPMLYYPMNIVHIYSFEYKYICFSSYFFMYQCNILFFLCFYRGQIKMFLLFIH